MNYKYNAVVTRVVDGDTFDATIDLGFHVSTTQRFRMAGYDAPESYRPKNTVERIAGQNATAALSSLIEGEKVTIHSQKSGKYGRWIATVFDDTLISVNQQMIDMGHVK